MKPKNSRAAAAAAALVILGSQAHAAQTKNVRDGAAVEAIIAASETTRIRVDGAKIKDVVGNIYSSSCTPKEEPATPAAAAAAVAAPAAPAVNPQGEFVLGCDLERGEIYVSPVASAGKPDKPLKPINIFVSTDKATYTLRLRRADVPADTIVLVDTAATSPALPKAGKSSQHVRALKEMLLVMAGTRSADDVAVEPVNRDVLLWKEAKFVQVRQFRGRGLVGEEYRLTNLTDRPMVLAEQEFDRAGAQVLAVAIDNLNLQPRDSTAVFVIRAGE